MPKHIYTEHMPEQPPADGMAWRQHRHFSTMRLSEWTDPETGEVHEGDIYLKRAQPFGGVAEARAAYEAWKTMGYDGAPTSPASFFRERAAEASGGSTTLAAKTSANNRLAKHFRPLWIEARRTRAVHGTWHHYDLNKAFFHAGVCTHLPSRLMPYRDGDRNYVAVMEHPSAERDLPSILTGERVLVTSEDVRFFGMRGKIIGGVTFGDLDTDFAGVFDALRPTLSAKTYKKMQSSYWGIFASTRAVQGESWKGGKKKKAWPVKNRFNNLVWASLISHRVMRRCYPIMEDGGTLVYVDSVVSPYTLPTGTAPGEWRHEKTFSGGLYVRSPGAWTDLKTYRQKKNRGQWYRHAGTPAIPAAGNV